MSQPSELEKTQLEIAKLQLEQERQKLDHLRQRQKLVSGFGQSAAAAGGAAARGTGAVLRYAGRWVVYAVVIELFILVAFAVIAAKFPMQGLWPLFGSVDVTSGSPTPSTGWEYSFGAWLGRVQTPNILSVFVGATVGGFVPIRDTEAFKLVAGGIPFVIFAGWYLLTLGRGVVL